MTAATPTSFGRGTRLLNRLAAWTTRRMGRTTGFTTPPEPRLIGTYARGQALLAGRFMLSGYLVQAADVSPWQIAPPHPHFEAALHGFGWLDDLAAVGDRAARGAAQDWTAQWIERHGRGGGPGWAPHLAGRRLLRWICHGLLLTAGQDPARTRALMQALSHHAAFVDRRWEATPPGLPRIEALTGLLCASLTLQGMEGYEAPARDRLRRACRAHIDDDGAIASRNPEDLLDVVTLLTLATAVLAEAGKPPEPALDKAVARSAVTLRTLRHADGALARFHGGGRGAEGRLDQVLAQSRHPHVAPDGRAMGYARLAGGRSTVIVDAAPPPIGPGSERAHASTLAFELTSHRRPVVVNCGAGTTFGSDWERASRATAMHSTLALDRLSSARMGLARRGAPMLADGPQAVGVEHEKTPSYSAVLMSHDGYVGTHGLTHLRRLDLSRDGRALSGEDTLVALSAEDRRRFERALARAGSDRSQAHGGTAGIAHALRFHLHPDAPASLNASRTEVSVTLPCGEGWVFRHDGAARLTLEPSVYLDPEHLRPRATVQIVLSAAAQGYTSQIAWTLSKAPDTPVALRDIGRDDPLALPDL